MEEMDHLVLLLLLNILNSGEPARRVGVVMDMGIIWKVLLIGGLAIAGVASRFVLKMKRDNQIEEAAEHVIQRRTGFDIDLSPDNSDKEFDAEELVREGIEIASEIRTGSNDQK